MKKIPRFIYEGDLFLIGLEKGKRAKKRAVQQRKRKAKYGFSDDETWSLDYTIACFALPRLKRYKKITKSFPSSMEKIEDWYEILDKIIFSLEAIVEERIFDTPIDERIQEGCELFGKYFLNLWW